VSLAAPPLHCPLTHRPPHAAAAPWLRPQATPCLQVPRPRREAAATQAALTLLKFKEFTRDSPFISPSWTLDLRLHRMGRGAAGGGAAGLNNCALSPRIEWILARTAARGHTAH
jgi:hypothetical protein